MGWVLRRSYLLVCAFSVILVVSLLQYLNSKPFDRITTQPKADQEERNRPASSNTTQDPISYISNDTTVVASPTVPRTFLTSAPPRFVITNEEYGQLGNAMFQYAGTIGVGLMNNKIPLANLRSQLRYAFKLKHVLDPGTHRDFIILGEDAYGKYDPKFERLPEGNIYVQAYFQSYRYFKKYGKEVREEFQFLDDVQNNARAMLERLKATLGERTMVGVHVRRGDKLGFKDRSQGDMVASDTYFHKAFQWMREHHGNVSFLVATDDDGWCRQSFEKEADVTFLPPASREVHLCLLSLCHHVIMSVGSFGWWAGWLGGGDVIYYKHQVLDGSPRAPLFNISDFAPPSWIGIGD